MANNQVADTQTQQNITDDEWVARAGTQEGPNPTPANLQMQSPMTDEEWVAKQAHENQTPGVVTPVTPIGTEMPKNSEPVPKTLQGHLSATVKPFYDFVADEFGIGMTGVHEGEEGILAQWGHQSFQDAEAHLETDKAYAVAAKGRIDAFRNANAAYSAFS